MRRLLTAVILIPLIYLYVMRLPQIYFTALIVVVSLIAQSEFYSMYKLKGALKWTALAFGMGAIIAVYQDVSLTDVIMLSVIVIAGLRLLTKKAPGASLYEVSSLLLGLFYIPLLLSSQISLRKEGGPEWIMFLYGSVWASDSLAYYMGTAFGKRKLYEEVSPNKTEAGAVGSIIGGIGGAVLLRAFFNIQMPYATTIMAGAIIGVASVLGDLVESMFKRDAGVKDSGSLIPGGHGGVLDKIDSALFAGTTLYWMLKAMSVI
ncbi:MAG: phosphatidate cytidylyltransferase [Nitrospirae bacterium]|nr:phosphatidate cytidylyltransferase [Nitrospirota bacterium]